MDYVLQLIYSNSNYFFIGNNTFIYMISVVEVHRQHVSKHPDGTSTCKETEQKKGKKYNSDMNIKNILKEIFNSPSLPFFCRFLTVIRQIDPCRHLCPKIAILTIYLYQ